MSISTHLFRSNAQQKMLFRVHGS